MKAKVSQIVDENTIHAQHGWWFPEADPNAPELFDTLKCQINNLIPGNHNGIIGFGAPFKSMICNIEPTDKNFDTDMEMIQERFRRID